MIIETDQPFTITWSSVDWLDPDGNSLPVKIELSRDNGVTWETVDASAPNTGSYTWMPTGPATSQGVIKLSDPGDPDVFAINTAFEIQNRGVVDFGLSIISAVFGSSVITVLGTSFSETQYPVSNIEVSPTGTDTWTPVSVITSWADDQVTGAIDIPVGTYDVRVTSSDNIRIVSTAGLNVSFGGVVTISGFCFIPTITSHCVIPHL